MTLYLQFAETLGSRIEQGLYRPGDRLPSVRAMSIEHGVSLSTVQQAYRLLEDRGLAEPMFAGGIAKVGTRMGTGLAMAVDDSINMVSCCATWKSSSPASPAAGAPPAAMACRGA